MMVSRVNNAKNILVNMMIALNKSVLSIMLIFVRAIFVRKLEPNAKS